jgi:cation diffusion facilitator CzcD-associated flavoprotein CzcO
MPDTNPPTSDLHVLIIGAGITGLVLAQGLQKVGCFQFTKSKHLFFLAYGMELC